MPTLVHLVSLGFPTTSLERSVSWRDGKRPHSSRKALPCMEATFYACVYKSVICLLYLATPCSLNIHVNAM
jgi:hypothetical protein